MSSLSESRLSVLIVKHSFSQMRAGWQRKCGNFGPAASGHLLRWRSRSPQASVPPFVSYPEKGIRGELRLPAFERHVFVCHNSRPADAPRPSCTTDGKSELHTRLQQLTKEAGLGGKGRINKPGCLDQCEHGPTVVVYPDAVWYGGVQPQDAEEIVAEHLVA